MITNNIKNTLIAFFLYLLLVSCADKKISGCRRLVSVITPLEEKIKESDDNNLEAILDTAQTFELTSQAMMNQTFDDDNLQKYSSKLSQVYQNYADNTRSFVDAYEKKDQEKGIFYQQQIINLFSQQTDIVREINGYCD